jgi:hypothetical protein
MAVGTNIGRAYDGRQGVQFATTFNTPLADQEAAQRMADEKALKDAHDNAMRRLYEKTPEWWVAVDNYMSNRNSKLLDDAAGWMTSNPKGDIFTSSDTKAVDWRKAWTEFNADAKQSMQLRDTDIKNRTAVTDHQDKYDTGSTVEVLNFPYDVDPKKLLGGEVQIPVLKFKEPQADTYKFLLDSLKEYENGKNDMMPLSLDRAIDYMTAGLDSPNNEIVRSALAQQFKQLPADIQTQYIAMGERNVPGKQGELAGIVAYAADQMTKLKAPPSIDIEASLTDIAAKAPTAKSTKETGGYEESTTTEKEYLADKDYSRKRAEGFVDANYYILDAPEYAMFRRNAGIDDTQPYSNRRATAINYMARRVQAQITLDNSMTKEFRHAGGMTKKQEEDANNFIRDFYSFDFRDVGDKLPTKGTQLSEKAGGVIAGGKIPTKYGTKEVDATLRDPKNGTFLFRISDKDGVEGNVSEYSSKASYIPGDVVSYKGDKFVIYRGGERLNQVLSKVYYDQKVGRSTYENEALRSQQDPSVDNFFK